MEILNLYCGLGGNRSKWGDEHDILACDLDEPILNAYGSIYNDHLYHGDALELLEMEVNQFDFIWASPPCQTHSRASNGSNPKMPNMDLWKCILFLMRYAKRTPWVVENVIPYYNPFIRPSHKFGRHYLWTNFAISPFDVRPTKFKGQLFEDMSAGALAEYHSLPLKRIPPGNKRQYLRNMFCGDLGLHILNCSKQNTDQLKFLI